MIKFFKSPYGIILTLIVGTILWFLSGILQSKPEPYLVKPADNIAAPLPRVTTILSKAEPHPIYYAYNGKTEAAREVTLQSRAHSTVEKHTAVEGRMVDTNQIIMRLAVEDRQLQLGKAKALAEQRVFDYTIATKLAAKKYLSKKAWVQARTNLETAKWELKQKELELDNITIKAPFKGILNTYHAESGQTVQPGTKLLTLVELDPLYIKIHIHEKHYPHLKVGQKAIVSIEGFPSVEGTLDYIAAVAEIESNTFEGHIVIPNTNYEIPAGISATVKILGKTDVPMHKLPSVVLSLADDGTIGVKTVNDQQQVTFHPVTIQESNTADIWVQGLPETAHPITIGQEFVKVGEKVSSSLRNTIAPS